MFLNTGFAVYTRDQIYFKKLHDTRFTFWCIFNGSPSKYPHALDDLKCILLCQYFENIYNAKHINTKILSMLTFLEYWSKYIQ